MVDLSPITGNPLFLGLVFILFVLSLKKLKKIVFNALWISLAAVLFPIAMNKLFGFAVPTDANSIIFYLTIGLGAYFVYLLARAVYATLSITEKIASPFVNKIKGISARKREKKLDKLIKDKEKEEEQLKKIAKKSEKRKKAKLEDDYVILKDTEEKEKEEENKNIVRKS